MTASPNPIELIGGMTSTANVPKADIVAWAKARVPQVLANVTEIRNTLLAAQLVVYLVSNGVTYFIDTSDTTTADDGINCIISGDGFRFKPKSAVPAPTIGSLGGVFSSAAVTHQFVTGLDTSGNLTRAQPAAADLSDGNSGTGQVVHVTGGQLAALTALGIRSGAAFDLKIASTEALTATRTLSVVMGDANRALSLAGDVTLAGALTTSGANALTLTTTGPTNVTLPTTGTLATRAGAETLTNKTFDASLNTLSNITAAMFATNVVDTDATLAANSTTRIPTQSAVKSYVDNNLTGLQWKSAVLVATTANITLSGEQTIDGTLTSGSRVLVKNQSTASQNGIYVSAAGSWTRATDMDAAAEFPSATVFVEAGTVNGDTQWTCTNNPTVTVGTTSIAFAQVSGAGTYSAGTGLGLSGNQFSIDATVATLAGAQALTNKSYNGLTLTATTGTLTLTNAKTFAVSNSLTLTGTDGSTVAFGSGGTVAYAANNLSVFASTTSSQLAGVISDETGSGALVFANTPTLVTPVLGAAIGTSLALGGATLGGNALAVTGTVASGAHVITSASASALAVGLNGATNPALLVDASTASSATGLSIKSAVAAAGIALAVLSSGTNESLTINAKGTGGITLANVSTGTIAAAAALDVQQAVTFSGSISPPQITADQNDYAPTGFSTASVIKVSTDASRNVTGLAGGANGRAVFILNTGSFAAVLKDEGAGSTAANRFGFGADLTLASKQGCYLVYDSTNSRWRQVGGPSASGGGSGTVTSVATSGILTGGTITTSGTLNVNATIEPQGRLTPSSGVPVQIATVAAAGTIYYTPAGGNLIPLYDGTNFVPTAFAEVSQTTTDTTKSPAAVGPWECCDVLGWSDGGTFRAARGSHWSVTATITVTIATPAVVTWTGHGLPEGAPVIFTTTGALPTGITAGTVYFVGKSPAANTFNIATSRANVVAGTLVATSGSQSGTHTGENRTTVRGTAAALTLVNGVYLNNASVTNGPAASRGTFLGTLLSNGTSTIDWQFGGTGAGGVAGLLGIWNAYNREEFDSFSGDTAATWTFATSATWRAANASATIRTTVVRGLNVGELKARYEAVGNPNTTATVNIYCGIGLNSTTAVSGTSGYIQSPGATAVPQKTFAVYDSAPNNGGYPGIGMIDCTAIERQNFTTTTTWYGFSSGDYQNGINVSTLQ